MHMGQSWNGPALRSLIHAIRRPALLRPHIAVGTVADVDWARLHDAGARGVVFDKDNTLTAPYANAPFPLVAPSYRRCLGVFGPERVVIVSNSAGTPDDPRGTWAEQAERGLGVRVVRHDVKKPLGFESVRRAFEPLGVGPDELVVVGDRLSTDVLLGTLHGCLTVHCGRVLTARGDNPVARVARRVENDVVLRLNRGEPVPCALYARWRARGP